MSDGDDITDDGGDDPGPGQEPGIVVRVVQTITPGFIRRSFALKFGLVLLIMAVSIAGIGLAATDQITAETRDNVESEYRNVANSEADVIEVWQQQNRLSTRFISRNPELTANTTQEVATALQRERFDLGQDAYALHVIEVPTGDDPRVITSAGGEVQPGTTLAEGPRSWFARNVVTIEGLETGAVFVNETYAVGDQRVMGFVSPVQDASNRYLLIEVSVSGIASSLQGEERADGGFTQVVDTSQNRIIIAENSEETLSTYATSESALAPLRETQDLRNATAGAGVISEVEGNDMVIDETYTVGYAPVEGTDWAVLTHAPQSSVFGFVQTISQYGLFATAAAVLLITITGAALGYSTSTSIDRLTDKTEEMQDGNLDVEFYTSREDNIGRLYDGFASMRDALREQIQEAERARKEAEVSRAEALEMSNYLEEKAEEYSDIMQQCAAGDLTQRMDQDGENEAMDQIADEFNDMIEELEKTTGQLKSYVDEVEEAGSEVEQSANTVRKASEQVADSIQKITVDSENQKERLQSISETMDSIADELERFAAEHPEANIDDQLGRIQEIAGEVNEIAELSQETQSETDNVSAAAEEQAAELNEVSERAHDLQRYAQPLRDILERFETEAEHEFVFSVGPTGSAGPSGGETEDDD
jgi:methyl-accepting chemotaxis protein